MAEILNLDTIVPEPRIIQYTPPAREPNSRLLRSFFKAFPALRPRPKTLTMDVSTVTVRTALEVERSFSAFVEAGARTVDGVEGEEASQEAEAEMYRVIEGACRAKNPWVTRDWLQEHLNPDQVLAMFQFILKPLQEKLEKNLEAVQMTTGR